MVASLMRVNFSGQTLLMIAPVSVTPRAFRKVEQRKMSSMAFPMPPSEISMALAPTAWRTSAADTPMQEPMPTCPMPSITTRS